MERTSSLISYIFIFCLGSLLMAAPSKDNNKTVSWLNMCGIAIVVLFAAGRYHVGTDCLTYFNSFVRYSLVSWKDVLSNYKSEWGFIAIAKITFTIGGRVLTWGTFAAITLFFPYLTIKREYPYASIGIAILYYLFAFFATSFNITKEFVAVAIVFWGLKYVFKNDLKKYIIVVFIAFCMHSTAIIAIIAWFLWDHKENKAVDGSKRVVLVIACFLGILVYQEIIQFFVSHFAVFEEYASFSVTSLRGNNRDLYLRLAQLILIIIFGKYLCEIDERNSFYITLMVISVLINITGFTHPQVKRLNYYFLVPAATILIGYLPNVFSFKSKKYMMLFAVCYAVFEFTLVAYILGQANLIPYRFDLFSEW